MRVLLIAVAVVPALPAAEPIDFARDVRPILSKRCVSCHGPKKQEGGLRLDVRRRVRRGGDAGPAFVPGPTHGEVLKRVTARDEKSRMPPDEEPLPAKEIATLRAWAEQGATWPDELAGKEAAEEHWAFQPVRRPAAPAVRAADRVRNPIDTFVLARLEPAGLTLSPEADRRTLARRLHFDLTGLPPSPAVVAAFVDDRSPDAYGRLVDGLLASPHFGERWGRHWLD